MIFIVLQDKLIKKYCGMTVALILTKLKVLICAKINVFKSCSFTFDKIVDVLVAGERRTSEDGHTWNPVEKTVDVKYRHHSVNEIAGNRSLIQPNKCDKYENEKYINELPGVDNVGH